MKQSCIFKKILSILLCFLFFLSPLTACHNNSGAENSSFTSFTDQLFLSYAASDALSLNYTIANPANFGIEEPLSELGTFTMKELRSQLVSNENLLAQLQTFSPDSLSLSQLMLYDTLSVSAKHAAKEGPLLLFNEMLGPVSGIQAQLPVLLCEYHFRDKNDFDRYLSLLSSIPTYYESLLAWEETRMKNGISFNASTLTNIILQCREFIRKPEKNILITNFNKQIQGISFLSNNEKKSLKSRNKSIVLDSVIPSYQNLILGLERLITNAKTDGGLCSLPKGSDYYTYLVQSSVGTLYSVDDMWNMLSTALETSRKTLLRLAAKDPSLFSSGGQLGTGQNTPSEIIQNLKKAVTTDFPAIPEVNCDIRYVDESLEDFLSPAFYLTPPIDETKENVIYINRADKFRTADLFPTLAHEGYPGHLYQNVYENQTQGSPLHSILNFGGYSEGWATYAELYSYKYAEIKPELRTLLQCNTLSALCLHSLCDIGIHYKGWDLEKTYHFLSENGVTDREISENIYQTLLDEPGTYLKYSVGYLEIERLKKSSKELLGEDYSDKIFHTYILNAGPTWFPVLEQYMAQWFENNK